MTNQGGIAPIAVPWQYGFRGMKKKSDSNQVARRERDTATEPDFQTNAFQKRSPISTHHNFDLPTDVRSLDENRIPEHLENQRLWLNDFHRGHSEMLQDHLMRQPRASLKEALEQYERIKRGSQRHRS